MTKAQKKTVKEIKDSVEALKEELESCFDRQTEAWQRSDYGDQCIANMHSLQKVLNILDEVE